MFAARGIVWLVAVEALEALSGVGKAGAPLPNRKADEEERSEDEEQSNLRMRVQHGGERVIAPTRSLECEIRYGGRSQRTTSGLKEGEPLGVSGSGPV